MNIEIEGKTIELNERPTHLAVMKVQNFMTEWLLSQIDTTGLDASSSIENALHAAMLSNPELTMQASVMQQTAELDQTIMLATGMSYKELSSLTETMYEADYLKLFEASKKAIGGVAEDFFGVYDSGIRLRNQRAMEKALEILKNSQTQETSPSEISSNQQSSSSKTSTEPSTEKMSANQD